MKKILFSFFLLFFYNAQALSKDFNWNKVVVSKDGSNEFYLDKKSLRSIANYNYQWLMTNYRKDSEEVKSDISYAKFDCKKNRMQIIIWSEYTEFDAKGKIRGHSLTTNEELEWATAKDGTIMSALVENSCKDKTFTIDSTDTEDNNISEEPKRKKSKYKEF